MPRLLSVRGFEDADDIAAVLHSRLSRATAKPADTRPARLIAGLVPEACGPMSAEMRQALDQRRELMERRVIALVDAAVAAREPWITQLGPTPSESSAGEAWRREARVIAAYRDRYGIFSGSPLGPPAETDAQRLDAAHATAALHRARNTSTWSAHDPLSRTRRTQGRRTPRL